MADSNDQTPNDPTPENGPSPQHVNGAANGPSDDNPDGDPFWSTPEVLAREAQLLEEQAANEARLEGETNAEHWARTVRSRYPTPVNSDMRDPDNPLCGCIRADLRIQRSTKIEPVYENFNHILSSAVRWRGVFAFDEFHQRIVLKRQMPGVPGPRGPFKNPPQFADKHARYVRQWLARFADIKNPPKSDVMESIWHTAEEASFDSLIEHVEAVEWDGTPRLDNLALDYLHALSHELIDGVRTENKTLARYNATVCRKFLIGMVARALDPGCKNDNVLILEGKQGVGKSTALKILAGGAQWFRDHLPKQIDGKDAQIALQGVWLVEMAELDSMRRAEVTAMKTFISTTEDKFRMPYTGQEGTFPRRMAFAGSTNAAHYLKDKTGHRRFWPLKCTGALDLVALKRDRDQLIAEAVAAYENGEDWLLPQDLHSFHDELTGQRMAEDPLESKIEGYLLGQDFEEAVNGGAKGPRFSITVAELVERALETSNDRQNVNVTMDVAQTLIGLGWEQVLSRTGKRSRVTYNSNDGKKIQTSKYMPVNGLEWGLHWLKERGGATERAAWAEWLKAVSQRLV